MSIKGENIKLLERNKDLNVVFVGGKYNGQIMKVSEVLELEDFSGKLSSDMSEWRNKGGRVKRPELDCIPQVNGYTDLWEGRDGISIRYETWEIYNSMW